MIEDWRPLYYSGWEGYHRLLQTLRPKVAFDLGANTGDYIPPMLAHGVQKVYAFEPVPDVCRQMRDKFENDERVTVHQIGISDHAEVLKDVLPTFAWALLPENSGAVARDYVDTPRFDVHCTTIDDYVAASGVVPDFLKIDVDGYECHALQGGERLFTTKRPWMLFELSDLMRHVGRSVEQMCNLIYQYDYKAVSLDLAFTCRDAATLMRHFPYNSSYDVFLLPTTRVS
jgi:FkbM family methyltransferase